MIAPPALDPLDDLALCGERADEPIEVRDDHDLGLAGLDQLDRLAEPVATLERRSAGDVGLVAGGDEG
jgi:hypothetical protein